MSKKYKIGQVLYIISPQSQSVVPVQIQEINQRTTIDGEETIFMVMDPEGRGPHNLDEINGQVYTNASDVGKFLKENASKAIDAMMQNAQSIAKSKFGSAGGTDDIFPAKKKKEISQTVTKSVPATPNLQVEQKNQTSEEGVEMVPVIGKDGKSMMQKTKVRVRGPDGKVLTA